MRSDPLPAGADLTIITIADDAGAAAPEDKRDEPRIVTATALHRLRRGRFFGELPLALVICGVGVGLLVIAMHHFRWGNLAISISVLAGALFRLVLPARKAGLLVVRSRFTDVVTMGVIGGALMLLAAVTST